MSFNRGNWTHHLLAQAAITKPVPFYEQISQYIDSSLILYWFRSASS
ncbi:hypothetical protein SynMVIR181_02761 [Synechococcus sp. MVIR-18-1]|nr:hypothetical protein SynMVIR181_02761 [Synechococcus sp. MVIR-18-1]